MRYRLSIVTDSVESNFTMSISGKTSTNNSFLISLYRTNEYMENINLKSMTPWYSSHNGIYLNSQVSACINLKGKNFVLNPKTYLDVDEDYELNILSTSKLTIKASSNVKQTEHKVVISEKNKMIAVEISKAEQKYIEILDYSENNQEETEYYPLIRENFLCSDQM